MLILELKVFVCDKQRGNIHNHRQPRSTHLYTLWSCLDTHHPQKSLQRGQKAAAAHEPFFQESCTSQYQLAKPCGTKQNQPHLSQTMAQATHLLLFVCAE